MDRPLKPAPDHWWWPRLTPGFVVLSVVLGLLLVVIQLFSIDAGLYLMMAAVWGPIVLTFRHRARVAKRVLSRPGVTCPCCLRELAADAPCCARCDAGLGRSVYVDYWTMVSEKPAEAEPWWRSMREAEGERGRSTYLSSAARWQVGLLVGMLGLSFLWVVLLRPAALLALDSLWMLPMYMGIAGGIWLARTRGRRRAGTSTHCVGCDYQVDPTRLDMPECPECGRRLKRPGQTIVGRRVGHGGYTLLGFAIVLASVLSIFVPLVGGSFFDALSPSSYLPVSLYVDDALSGDPDYQTWEVLKSRYAEPEDVERLADAGMLWMEDGTGGEAFSFSFSMGAALAFQLDGPNATDAVKQEVALAMMANPEESRLYQLYDWLEKYLQSTTAGSTEHRELVAAAEAAFVSGAMDYRVLNWLEAQRGERLTIYNEFGRFCRCALVMEVVQTDAGTVLVVRTHPDAALSPRHWPDENVTLFLRIFEPGQAVPEDAPSTMQYNPLEHIGRSHTLVTIPITGSPRDAEAYRLRYVVTVTKSNPFPSLVRWRDGQPAFPDRFYPIDTYGPMELAPGWVLARDVQQSPRQPGTGNPPPLPPLPSRPR